MSSAALGKKDFVWLVIIAIVFVALRLPAVHQSYHQDEFKWVYDSESGVLTGVIPHPPLAEFTITEFGGRLGENNFRFIPLIFGTINVFLLFYLVKIIFDKRTAFWSVFLFAVSYYSVLASLMVDVDGQVMPFFFLIMAISYFKLRAQNFELKGNWLYIIIFIFAAVCSFLVKLSGILPLGAMAIDYAIEKGVFKDIKKVIKYGILGLIALIICGALVYFSKYIFTYFNIPQALKYWEHFANSSSFLDRGWLQTFIQFAKSILYTSPLLIVPSLFINKEIWRKTRPFFLFVFVGLIFYLVAFDFSLGALDRYFQYLVIPFCIIAAAAFAKYFGAESDENGAISKNKTFLLIIAAAIVFSLQFLPQFVPPLYPKVQWLSRLVSLKWNFLFPFTGGSGPSPFYVSFAFIGVSWVVCLLFFLTSLKRPGMKRQALLGIFIIGLVYNAVFIEEYAFGRINGNTQTLINDATAYIKNNDNIKEVLVYNDNGGFEIQHTGKYKRRIYAVPAYESVYKPIFENFRGDILFIDIPKLADDSFYKKYFDSCKVIYTEKNGQINSTIYDCSKSP